MKQNKHIIVVAGEPSGDLHGANLIRELIKKNPNLIITGIGGDKMSLAGMKLFFHIKELSAMGLTEVIVQFRQIKQAFDLLRKNLALKPDLLILIDYPGFNLKAAQYAKKLDINILYYITPKVWAWNRSRLKKIKQYVDHAAIVFPFEEPIFKKADIPATYVGNPLLDYYEPNNYISNTSTSSTSAITIGILPGSRESEISNLFEIMLQSAILINKAIDCDGNDAQIRGEKISDIKFLISAAPSINIDKFNKILEPYDKNKIFEVVHGDIQRLFKRCDLLVAASGTVTLEAAICGVPMVIVYKTSPFTYFLAKTFVKIPHISLPNIIAKHTIVPELLQNNATPEKIAKQVLSMLNPKSLSDIKKQLLMIPRYLGGSGAAERTAKIAIKMLER